MNAAATMEEAMEEVEVLEYKGKKIKIYYDEDSPDPRDRDNLGTMCCWHRRYSLGDEQPRCTPDEVLRDLVDQSGQLEELEKYIGNRYYSLDCVVTGEKQPFAYTRLKYLVDLRREELLEERYVIIPLYLYDHSGLAMNTGGFSTARWRMHKRHSVQALSANGIPYFAETNGMMARHFVISLSKRLRLR